MSRTISHALRHEPWLYELELDEEGWVDVEMLLGAIRGVRGEWQRLTERDIVQLMEQADKQRFELRDGRIRALYGHSTGRRVRRLPAEPPAVLYHGTSPESAFKILKGGLKPMNRQYVHLSVDRETALQVGLRKARRPWLLEVVAADAYSAGVPFYAGNEQVWLADAVPPVYIRLPQSDHDDDSRAALED